MKTLVVVTLQVEALHNWPEARSVSPEVGYLADLHRHIFYITAKKKVDNNNDRNTEIIMFKRELQDYFKRNYYVELYRMCNFGAYSCETIAKDLVEAYDLEYCQVLEDNENGAEVCK